MVDATDTGVVVIAVAVSSILQNCEVWIAFGHDNNNSVGLERKQLGLFGAVRLI